MKLLRTNDVAAILGIHRHQVERLRHEGKIPSVSIPGMSQRRFDSADIEAFIEANKSRPVNGPSGEAKSLQVVERLATEKKAQGDLLKVKNLWRQGLAK